MKWQSFATFVRGCCGLALLGTAATAHANLFFPGLEDFYEPAPPTRIAVGQSIAGQLDLSDEVVAGFIGDCYEVYAPPGTELLIDLTSSEFDAYMVVGTGNNCLQLHGLAFDDDGGDGTNARLTIEMPPVGVLLISVESFFDFQLGAYTLSVQGDLPEDFEAPPVAVESRGQDVAPPVSIEIGQTLSGALETTDTLIEEVFYSDCYVVRAPAGTQITVDLVSSEFDAYLLAGVGSGCAAMTLLQEDDDSGDDTNARLTILVPEGGELLLSVESYSPFETGAYTLSVQGELPLEPAAPEAEGVGNVGPVSLAPVPIEIGQTLPGALETTDTVVEEAFYSDCYVVRAPAGTAIVADLMSTEFDAYLLAGFGSDCVRMDLLAEDDDSGEGSNARIALVVPEGGELLISVETYFEFETGAYTLSVSAQE